MGKKAMVDAARLADELRAEQDHASSQEKAKRTLESQVVELENRLAEANGVAVKGGRNAMAKLESRIREMKSNLEVFKAEHRKHTRATRSPSVALKSSTSNAKRTKRILTVSPNWPPSYNKR